MSNIGRLLTPCAALLLFLFFGLAQAAPPVLPQPDRPSVWPAGRSVGDSSAVPSSYARVSGVVTDSLGRPVASALVEISNGLSAVVRRTSATGEFSVDSLVAGKTYTVLVARLGFHVTETEPFVVHAGTPRLLTLVMQPRSTVTIPAKNPRKKTTGLDTRLAAFGII